jgi:hypothetical protein
MNQEEDYITFLGHEIWLERMVPRCCKNVPMTFQTHHSPLYSEFLYYWCIWVDGSSQSPNCSWIE